MTRDFGQPCKQRRESLTASHSDRYRAPFAATSAIICGVVPHVVNDRRDAMPRKPATNTLVSALESWTPASLTKPGHDCEDESHYAALLRWADAYAPGEHRLRGSTFFPTAEDQTVFFGLGGHVSHVAILRATQIDVEQERSARLLAAKQGRAMPRVREHEARMAVVFREREAGKQRLSKGARPKGAGAARRDMERLQELQKEAELLEGRMEQQVGEYDAVRESLVVPFVASEYFDNARRPEEVTKATILLHVLTAMNVPLIVAIAMIGGLRLGSTPVDLAHPDLRGVCKRHSKNLAGFSKVEQKSMRRWSPVEPE